ncbi:hypothetical protein M413DRAFT_443156 [Hebeloma cylindrosporum]|uniref:SMODS and SLOG-associating 2TM effector domain-containing protein n=1 Tax=Hebeloma cylindrosporum TaxID=76867 RepID=A0A0C3CJ69_HEBCY|nr:hypothetical protein M413DRAFT_443156 [Hebeloma cylindrosporum h7]
MDHDGFQPLAYAPPQRSEGSAAPALATATQFEQRLGASVASELGSKKSESTFPNPGTRSFSSRDDREGSPHSIHPLPPIPQDIIPIGSGAAHPDPRARPLSVGQENGLGRVVPREENSEKTVRERTVGERLDPTLQTAILEKDKYAFKARITGYALNVAIGLQILLGTLTTGLAVVVSGHRAQVSTAVLGGFAYRCRTAIFFMYIRVLGGFSTLVASFLARARGSNEPELSITRVKDLEQFIRECQAFKMDHGHVFGHKYDNELNRFRDRFEELLGNSNGERKLSPPV